jgi:hypothetical protein
LNQSRRRERDVLIATSETQLAQRRQPTSNS